MVATQILQNQCFHYISNTLHCLYNEKPLLKKFNAQDQVELVNIIHVVGPRGCHRKSYELLSKGNAEQYFIRLSALKVILVDTFASLQPMISI